MMYLKVFFVALAAVSAAQAHAVEDDASRIEAYGSSDIFNKIEAVLDQVRAQIKKMDQQVKDLIDSTYEKVEAVARANGEAWHEAVAKAQQQADKYGVDISECIAQSEALPQVVDSLVARSRQCIDNETPAVQTVQKKLDDLLNHTDSLMEISKMAAQECETKPLVEAAICSARYLTPLLVEATKQAARTTKASLEISAISIKSTAKVGACLAIATTAETGNGIKIVDKVNKCILDKIRLRSV